jgi:hypothetical protein
LVNIDTVQLAASTTAAASAENWDVTTIDITNGTGSATVSNLSAGQAIKSDDIDSGATLTLTAATGVTALTVELDTATASAGTLSTNATDLTINHTGVDGSGDFANNALILSSDVTGVTLTGGGETSSAGTYSKFTLSNGSGATVTSITSTYDGDLDVDAGSIFNATSGATVTTGANTVAATTFAAVGDLTNGLVHFNDTAGTDTLTIASTTGVDLGVINVDGYETFNIADMDMGAAMVANFRDSSGISTVSLTGPTGGDLADDISLLNASSALTLKVAGAYGDSSGADKLLVTANGSGSSDAIIISSNGANFVSGHADSQMEASGYETVTIQAGADDIDFVNSSKDMTLTLTGTTNLNVGGDLVADTDDGDITLGTLAATSVTGLALTTVGGSVSVADLGTMNSLETFTITSGTGETATVTAGTSTSVDAITITGAGATTITALTASSLDAINGGTATGAVTLGSASAALSVAAGATFTTGEGNDTISMSTAASLTLTAGEKTSDGDNLILVGAMNSGTGVINLAAADQVVTINAAADSAVQSKFEDVDVSAVTTTGSYGFSITAAAEGSTIVGSGANDTIYGGAAADTITGGAGNDTINLTVDGVADTINLTDAFGSDTITSYLNGTDIFNIQSVAAITVAKADGASTTGIQAITFATTGVTAVAVGGTSQGNVAFLKGTATALDEATEIDSAMVTGGSLEALSSDDSSVIIFSGADNDQTIYVYEATYASSDSGNNSTLVTALGTIELSGLSIDIDDLALSGLIA